MAFQVSPLARTVIVLALGAASAVASAEIRRCKDENGQTFFSDRPCGAAFVGQPLKSNTVGVTADRLAATEMRSGRSRESSYDFIPDRGGRSSDRSSMK